tara:strand:+ start:478 stop:1029 length:552 start_codon:yes stop_codon:yes gene_type:complete
MSAITEQKTSDVRINAKDILIESTAKRDAYFRKTVCEMLGKGSSLAEIEEFAKPYREENMDIVKEEKEEIPAADPFKTFTKEDKREWKTKELKKLNLKSSVKEIYTIKKKINHVILYFKEVLELTKKNPNVGDIMEQLDKVTDNSKWHRFKQIVGGVPRSAFYHLRPLMEEKGWNVKVIFNEV